MSEKSSVPTRPLTNTELRSRDTQSLMLFDANKKSVGVSYILWFFFGMLGGHRFYNGKTGSAVAQLLLNILGWLTIFAYGLGLIFIIPVAIWVVVDAFLIPGWVRNYNNLLIRQLEA